MKLPGLLHRTRSELPGITGVARVDRHTEALLRRLRRGDVVVLDQVDLDRATADALVAAEVGAVVNASPSISGRFPNLGPEIRWVFLRSDLFRPDLYERQGFKAARADIATQGDLLQA